MQEAVLSVRHVEFLSQDEVVEIVATAPLDEVELLCGARWGPFVPMRPTPAPLWLALLLKRKQRCRIKPPDWLTMSSLQAVLDAERGSEVFSETLPFQWLPVAYQLFAAAPDDIAELGRVRGLVEDVRVVRAEKIRRGVLRTTAAVEVLRMRGISAAEVCAVRRFMCGMMQGLQVMAQSAERVENGIGAAADGNTAQVNPFVGVASSSSSTAMQMQQRRILRPVHRLPQQ